jgi:hypothetical protein
VKHLCHLPRFQHQWRTADDLATLCHKWFSIPKLLQFDGNDINGALLKDPAMKLDIQADKSLSNHFGIYNDTYRPGDTNKKTQCYYLCDPNGKECVRSPPVGKAWYETLSSQMVLDEIQALECATRNKERKQFPPDVIDLVAKANVLLLQQSDNLENERETKRRCLVDASNSCDTNSGCEFTKTISVSNSSSMVTLVHMSTIASSRSATSRK